MGLLRLMVSPHPFLPSCYTLGRRGVKEMNRQDAETAAAAAASAAASSAGSAALAVCNEDDSSDNASKVQSKESDDEEEEDEDMDPWQQLDDQAALDEHFAVAAQDAAEVRGGHWHERFCLIGWAVLRGDTSCFV